VTLAIVAVVWCLAALLFALALGPVLGSVSPAADSAGGLGDDLLDQPAVDDEARAGDVASLG
jgi:hypothetical protein